jgi:hypothetical protein
MARDPLLSAPIFLSCGGSLYNSLRSVEDEALV